MNLEVKESGARRAVRRLARRRALRRVVGRVVRKAAGVTLVAS